MLHLIEAGARSISRLTKDILSLIKSVAEGSETHRRKPSTNGLNFPALLSRNHRRSLRARDSDYNLFLSLPPSLVPSLFFLSSCQRNRLCPPRRIPRRGLHHRYTATIISLYVTKYSSNAACRDITFSSRPRYAEQNSLHLPTSCTPSKGVQGSDRCQKIRSAGCAQSAPCSSTRTRTRYKYVNISSTRRGHVFSAGAPNSRRFPSPARTHRCSPRHPREQISGDPFRTRSATHKGSGLSYARYYTLYTISFQLAPTIVMGQARAGEEIRVAMRLGTVYLYLRPRIVNRDHRQWDTSAEPTKALRFPRLICCYSCLRRRSGHSSVRGLSLKHSLYFLFSSSFLSLFP